MTATPADRNLLMAERVGGSPVRYPFSFGCLLHGARRALAARRDPLAEMARRPLPRA